VGLDHSVDGVAAASTHANDLDARSAHWLIVILNAHCAGFVCLLTRRFHTALASPIDDSKTKKLTNPWHHSCNWLNS
jgi:hypothetical protein